MFKVTSSASTTQSLIGASAFVLAIWLAWQAGTNIVSADLQPVILAGIVAAGAVLVVQILKNWRSGLYLFIVGMFLEDLPRKYLGNGTVLFFGKDLLLAIVYVSFLIDLRKMKGKRFHPACLIPLVIFVAFALVQAFNPNSPSIFYGMLGVKLDFYYLPIFFLAYYLLRNEDDLKKFLILNGAFAAVIAVLGITQAIVGNSFLNPTNLAPELQDLGNLYKESPITHQLLSLPDSVFVSSGRYSQFLLLMVVLLLGGAGYLLLESPRGRRLIFLVIGVLGGGVLFSGSRGTVSYSVISVCVFAVAFLWGAPWKQRQARRSFKAVRRFVTVGVLALAALIFIFPDEAGSRIAFYAETLSPNSSAYEASFRAWDYPIMNFVSVFNQPNWLLGNGTGTASLGTQYVSKFLGQPAPRIGVEEGYGTLILEMGIIAPLLWIVWTATLLFASWRIVSKLRGTRFFPLAFAIFWYAFLLLYPFQYATMVVFQNYITNAYLWLLVGILFRLPDFLAPSFQSRVVWKAQQPAEATTV